MTRIITLPDGRNLAFAEYGRANDEPVLFCHSAPGSRLHISEAMSRVADAMGIWLIVPDRPGYGLSDVKQNNQANGSFLDWPKDVGFLFNHLGIDHFRVIAYSMGTAYALACAFAMPANVTHVSLVGALAPNLFDPAVTAVLTPGSYALYTLARDDPAQFMTTLQTLLPDADALYTALAGNVSTIDQSLLTQLELATIFKRDCAETLRQGHDGFFADNTYFANSWGFDLTAIHTPVAIWSGLEDISTPPAMARYLTEKLPRNKIHLLPDEGHLCLQAHWEEVLGSKI